RSERRSLRGSEGELGAGLCWRLAQARRRPSGYGEAAFATMGAWMGACPAEAGVACEGWWSQAGSNRRPRHCERRALPAELWPRRDRLERTRSDRQSAPFTVRPKAKSRTVQEI